MNENLAFVSPQLLWARENMPKLYLGACLMTVQPTSGELPLHASDQCFVCNADNKLMMEIILPFKAKKDKSKEDLDLSDETGEPQMSEGKLAKDNDWKDFIEEAIIFFSQFEVVKNPKVARATGDGHQCKFCVDRFGFDTFTKVGRRSGQMDDWSFFAGFCLRVYQKHKEKIQPDQTKYKSKSKITRSAKVSEPETAPLDKLSENSKSMSVTSPSDDDEGYTGVHENGNSDLVIVIDEHMEVDDDGGADVTVPDIIGSPAKALRLLCPAGPAVAVALIESQEPLKSDPKEQQKRGEKSSSSVNSDSVPTSPSNTSRQPRDAVESTNATPTFVVTPSDESRAKKVDPASSSSQGKESSDAGQSSCALKVTPFVVSLSPKNRENKVDPVFSLSPDQPLGKESSDAALQVTPSVISPSHQSITLRRVKKVAPTFSSPPGQSRGKGPSDVGQSSNALKSPSVISPSDQSRTKKVATVSRSPPGQSRGPRRSSLLKKKLTSDEEVDTRAIPMSETYQPRKNQRRFIACFQTAGEMYAKQVLKLKNLKRSEWIFNGFDSIAHIGVVPYIFNEQQRKAQLQYEQAMKKHTEKLVFGGASSSNQQSSAEKQINNYKRIVQSVAWDQQEIKKKYSKCVQLYKKLKKVLQDLKTDGGDVDYLKKRKQEILREATLCERERSELKTKLAKLQVKRDTALKHLFKAESSYKKTSAGNHVGLEKEEANACELSSSATPVNDQYEQMEVYEEEAAATQAREETDPTADVVRRKIAKWTNGMEAPRYVGPLITVDEVRATNAVSGPYSIYDEENNQIVQCENIEYPCLDREQLEAAELIQQWVDNETDIYLYQNPQPIVYTDISSGSDSDGETSLKNRLELVGGGDYSDAGAHCSKAIRMKEGTYKQHLGRKRNPKRKSTSPPKPVTPRSSTRQRSSDKEGATEEQVVQEPKQKEADGKSLHPTRMRENNRPVVQKRLTRGSVVTANAANRPAVSKIVTKMRLLSHTDQPERSETSRVDLDGGMPRATDYDDVFSDGSASLTDFEGWATKRPTTTQGKEVVSDPVPLPSLRTIESLKSGSIRSGSKRKIIDPPSIIETGNLGVKRRKGFFRSYAALNTTSSRTVVPSHSRLVLTEDMCRAALSVPIYTFDTDNRTLVLHGDAELSDDQLHELQENVLYYVTQLQECIDQAEQRNIQPTVEVSPSGKRKMGSSKALTFSDNECSDLGPKRRRRMIALTNDLAYK